MSTPGLIVNGDGTTLELDGTAGDDAFTGSNSGETFYTGLGDDVVMAGGGDDLVYADLGNDWLDGGKGDHDALYFTLVDLDSAGNQQIAEFAVTLDLSKHQQDLGYFGVKTIYSFEDAVGTTNNDRLLGSSVANVLTGNAGDDLLDGRAGDDTLVGETGKDTLIGGAGADTLDGDQVDSIAEDLFSDTFRYKAASESGTTALTRDTIWGFFDGGASGHGDRIDIGALSSSKFVFIGTHSFHATAAHEVRVVANGANEYLVSIDTDKDKSAEMTIDVHSTNALTAHDFVL